MKRSGYEGEGEVLKRPPRLGSGREHTPGRKTLAAFRSLPASNTVVGLAEHGTAAGRVPDVQS